MWVGLGFLPWETFRGDDFLLVELRKTESGSPTSAPGFLHLFTHNTLAMPSESALTYLKTKCLVAQVAQAQGAQVNLEL